MFVIGPRSKAVTFSNEIAALAAASTARSVIGKACKIICLGSTYKIKCGDAFVCRDV